MTETSPPSTSAGSPSNRGYGPGLFAYLKWLYTNFRGRIRLREMWFGHIVLFLVILIAGTTALVTGGGAIPDTGEARDQAMSWFELFGAPDAAWWSPLAGLGLLALLLFCGAALQVKRLHDRGKPAWWLAFFYGAPILLYGIQGTIEAAMGGAPESGTESVGASDAAFIIASMLGVIAGLINLWWFIELWLIPGKKGPNQWGPDIRQMPPTYRHPGAPAPTPPDASL